MCKCHCQCKEINSCSHLVSAAISCAIRISIGPDLNVILLPITSRVAIGNWQFEWDWYIRESERERDNEREREIDRDWHRDRKTKAESRARELLSAMCSYVPRTYWGNWPKLKEFSEAIDVKAFVLNLLCGLLVSKAFWFAVYALEEICSLSSCNLSALPAVSSSEFGSILFAHPFSRKSYLLNAHRMSLSRWAYTFIQPWTARVWQRNFHIDSLSWKHIQWSTTWHHHEVTLTSQSHTLSHHTGTAHSHIIPLAKTHFSDKQIHFAIGNWMSVLADFIEEEYKPLFRELPRQLVWSECVAKCIYLC